MLGNRKGRGIAAPAFLSAGLATLPVSEIDLEAEHDADERLVVHQVSLVVGVIVLEAQRSGLADRRLDAAAEARAVAPVAHAVSLGLRALVAGANIGSGAVAQVETGAAADAVAPLRLDALGVGGVDVDVALSPTKPLASGTL